VWCEFSKHCSARVSLACCVVYSADLYLQFQGGLHCSQISHFSLSHCLHFTVIHFHILLLIKRYISCRVLAFSAIFFHSRRSWASSDHLVIFIFLKSFLTSSHLFFGLPTGRVASGFFLYNTGFKLSVYMAKPTHLFAFNIVDYVSVLY